MERDAILERLKELNRERSQERARVSHIDAVLRSRRHGVDVPIELRRELVEEKMHLTPRLSELGGLIRETERELADVERARALEQMGVDSSMTAGLRALAVRSGRIERVFLAACCFVDDQNDESWTRLRIAVRKARAR